LLAKTPFMIIFTPLSDGRAQREGMDVGLPDGQMGKLGIGHLISAQAHRVSGSHAHHKAIADGELATNRVLQETVRSRASRRLHFIGLVSDGGVHSHQDHWAPAGSRLTVRSHAMGANPTAARISPKDVQP